MNRHHSPARERGKSSAPHERRSCDFLGTSGTIRCSPSLNGRKRHQTAERSFSDTKEHRGALKAAITRTAGRLADSLRTKFPNDPQAEQGLRTANPRADEHTRQRTFGSVTKQVEDTNQRLRLAASAPVSSSFSSAASDSVDARNLMLRISAMHRIFQEDQRRRMSAEGSAICQPATLGGSARGGKDFRRAFPGLSWARIHCPAIPPLENNAEM